MEITLSTIKEKLGFDPLNPPQNDYNGWDVDDHTPSIWAPLDYEEKVFLYKIVYGELPFA